MLRGIEQLLYITGKKKDKKIKNENPLSETNLQFFIYDIKKFQFKREILNRYFLI